MDDMKSHIHVLAIAALVTIAAVMLGALLSMAIM